MSTHYSVHARTKEPTELAFADLQWQLNATDKDLDES